MSLTRDQRQLAGLNWAYSCFPKQEVDSLPQRGLRFIEECFELCKVVGVPIRKILRCLIDVYARSAGSPVQELGGVGLTLLILAQKMDYSADQCEVEELRRVKTFPPSHFEARNAAKNAKGLIADEAMQKEYTIEENLLNTANDLAVELQKQRDIVAQYKAKYGEL